MVIFHYIWQNFLFVSLLICLYIKLFLSSHLSFILTVYLSVFPSFLFLVPSFPSVPILFIPVFRLDPSLVFYFCQSISLFLSVCLSVCLSIYLFVHLSLSLFFPCSFAPFLPTFNSFSFLNLVLNRSWAQNSFSPLS